MTDTTGNVSVRFSIEDQEVVREALANLGKAGEKALADLNAAQQAAISGSTALGKGVDSVKDRIVQLAQSLGPVGTALVALGPVGIAAGAAIGALALAIHYMSEEANRLGDKAIQIQNFADATGIAAGQVQALQTAGSRFGLSSQDIARNVERFAAQVDALRKGTGPLFDDLRRINPQLLDQVVGARDLATAIDAVAKAYAQMDVAQQAALTRAVGGRSSPGFGQLLGLIAQSGGVAGLAANPAFAPALTDEETKRFAALKTEIDETRKRAQDLIASLWTAEFLSREKEAVEGMLEFAKAMKDASEFTKNVPFWQRFLSPLFGDNPELGVGTATGSARQLLAMRMGAGEKADLSQWETFGLPQPPANSGAAGGASGGPGGMTLEVQLRNMRDWMALVGAAVTPAEQFREEQLKLDVALKNNVITQDQYNRALGAFTMAQRLAAVAVRERLGIASEEQILAVKLQELQDLRAKGFIRSDEEMARAEQNVRKEVHQTWEQLQVRFATFPGLKQLELDAQNLPKELDKLGTSLISNVSSPLVDIELGTVKTGEGFKRMGAAALRSLAQMANQLTINLLLAKALQAIFGGFGPGGAGAAGGAGGAGDGLAVASAHGGGVIGRDPLSVRHVPLDLFRFAPRLHSGGFIGPDEVPTILRRRERVLREDEAQRSSDKIEIHNYTGAAVRHETRRGGDGSQTRRLFIGEMQGGIGRGDLDAAMRDRYGIVPRGIPR